MQFALKRSTFRAVKSPFLKAKPVGKTSMTGYQFRIAVRSILHQPVHGNAFSVVVAEFNRQIWEKFPGLNNV